MPFVGVRHDVLHLFLRDVAPLDHIRLPSDVVLHPVGEFLLNFFELDDGLARLLSNPGHVDGILSLTSLKILFLLFIDFLDFLLDLPHQRLIFVG